MTDGRDPADWLPQLLRAHLARYPAMAAADVYKLLHQAALGPGHAVGDPAAALAALLAESAASAGPTTPDPALDPIGPQPGLVRCHLRPWLASGRSLDELHQAFVATAAAWLPEPERLARDLAAAPAALDRAGRPELAAALAELADRMAARAWPAVHHSPRYREAYRPAYRVAEAARLPGRAPRPAGP